MTDLFDRAQKNEQRPATAIHNQLARRRYRNLQDQDAAGNRLA